MKHLSLPLFVLFRFCCSLGPAILTTNKVEKTRVSGQCLAGLLVLLIFHLCIPKGFSQTNPNGCLMDGFGVNSTLYTGSNYGGAFPPAANVDWFKTTTGRNTIVQDPATVSALQSLLQSSNNNPTYFVPMDAEKGSYADSASPTQHKILYDALFARDYFGGSGAIDTTAFSLGSKNAQDPADWWSGVQKVLGKNDLIDISGHMFREIDSAQVPPMNDLNFVGIINRAEPGGDAYMDFEFFVKEVTLTQTGPLTSAFSTGGSEMGHTAFIFSSTGEIIRLGDMIYNVSLTNGGSTTNIEARIWVKYTDYVNFSATPQNLPFRFGLNFDGAVNGAPYGYASVVPRPGISQELCGYVNTDGQFPVAPPWGTKNTKGNVYGTTYQAYSVTEVGINMTSLGIDNNLVVNPDPCSFPWLTFIVKTRTSDSFTSALKDFGGPFAWGMPDVTARLSSSLLSCDSPTATITADPARSDATYQWYTTNGHISGSSTGSSIIVDKPGTYYVTMTLRNGCAFQSDPAVVTLDPAKPLFTGSPALSYTFPCTPTGGSITASVSGGTAPYTYSLYDTVTNTLIAQATGIAGTSYTFSGVSAGAYRVVVKGIYACTTEGRINLPAAVPVNYTPTLTHIDCYGDLTGMIGLGTVTGSSPFTYRWSTGNTLKDLSNIGAGTYTVSITDANGCVTTGSHTITQPAQPLTAVISGINDPGNSGDGSAVVTPSGGTPGYTYEWRKTPAPAIIGTDSIISNLGYGEYSVKVTDSKGCYITLTVFIYEKERCFDEIDNDGDGLTDCDDPECIPETPSITGPSTPCVADTVVYTITSPVAGMKYIWTLPSNATIVSGQTTASVSIRWNSVIPGQICVRAASEGPVPPNPADQIICYSPNICLMVVPNDRPDSPSNIIKN